jgi:hypothetical protein
MIGPRNTREDAKRGMRGTRTIFVNGVVRSHDSPGMAIFCRPFFLSRPFAYVAGPNPGGNS